MNNETQVQPESWNFEYTYRTLPEIFYRDQKPDVPALPEMVILNEPLAVELGLKPSQIERAERMLSGAVVPDDARPLSQAYAGFQYGHFTMLGDGRAVLLGEYITPDKRRVDIQLKGSGRTPFSRGGDGFAALLPMLREYIISEAMAALGIPTTRSLAVIRTGRDIVRETILPGAVLTRVAASHIRVGTFNFASQFGTKSDVQKLADYCIHRHFPHIETYERGTPERYNAFFLEVARLQAALIAGWQLVGFIHGVMNTDNMAISGETIDYGPCAFMDTYDPDTVFSSIDRYGRYCYKNQPGIGVWNLSRFVETLLPLLHDEQDAAIKIAEAGIDVYRKYYQECWLNGMRAKLGLSNAEDQDEALANNLLALMEKHKLDYTNTFRSLIPWNNVSHLHKLSGFADWNKHWQSRLARHGQTPEEIALTMGRSNPAVIPRNHRVEGALCAAGNGDLSVMEKLLAVLGKPFEESAEYSIPPEPSAARYVTYCGT
ncbi:MAG: YdiU family protein [Treponema sp.]|nr:YdiU family protein [Treponema sp.]